MFYIINEKIKSLSHCLNSKMMKKGLKSSCIFYHSLILIHLTLSLKRKQRD